MEQALDWMGHEDSAILRLYIKLFDQDAEKAIAQIRYTSVQEKGHAVAS